MKQSESRAIQKHLKAQYTAVTIRLHNERDRELLEIYRSIPNKREWLKECLRRYKNG